MDMKYDLTITPPALQFIATYQQKNFPNEEVVVILADLHVVGGLIVPEIQSRSFMFTEQRSAFDELFPKGYKDYPISVFVDHQAQIENSLPNEFLLDLQQKKDGSEELVFKNPHFE
ncbi:hypothetical protein [Candidatus Lokiarchaeum ossiferum]|uniref:hypothetical protein n=1 Tax=Candidatus Lokiarchaeum ossiferum TaxID=2951803 RepID=UPI00352C4796